MNTNLVAKQLDEIQTRAKVNCLELKDILKIENKIKSITKELINLGLGIEYCYHDGYKNKGWGANVTSINCTFNKNGTFKKIDINRTNSKNSVSYIKIWGYSELSWLEQKLIKKHFNCNNFGEINV